MSNVIAGFDIDFLTTLGSGGFGTVFEAKHVETGEPAAAKQTKLRSVRRDLSRILQEVENMKAVTHPNLVRYLHHHYLEEKGTFWVFVELCDLGDLSQYFVKKAPDRQEYLQLMLQMATAIVYLHEEKGIVHRDIKPGNILIKSTVHGSVPIVKICDFGSARIVDLESALLSFSTMNIGTRAFMAPELFVHGEVVRCDKFVDVFALGITFLSIICFKNETDRLIPSEDPRSCPEIGHEMFNMRRDGNLEKARSHPETVVAVKGDATEAKIRELILKMIQFDSKDRVEASVVLSSITDIILIQETAQMKLDDTDSGDTVKQKADDSESLLLPGGTGSTESGFASSQKSSEIPHEEMSATSISASAKAAPRGSTEAGLADSQKSNETPYLGISATSLSASATADPQGPSERREDESQLLEDQLYSLTVIKTDEWIHAVRSDSHNLTSVATFIYGSCDKNKLSCTVWEVTDNKNLSWRQRDLHVNHTLNLQESPRGAYVITIVDNMLLVRVKLDDKWNSQVISVNSSTSHVINKSQVYPGEGWSGYCRYKSQILLPDYSSSRITQLDLKTLNLVNTWSDERAGQPWSVCSNMNRAAVNHWDSHSISVFRWDNQQISHDLIFTVKSGVCTGMQLLTDDTLMAIVWGDEWSVWDESGTCVHDRVQHPVLVSGMKIWPYVMQDAVTGECFVCEYGKLNDTTECIVIYNARLVLKRIETEDNSQIDESQLEVNKTIKLK